VIFTYFAIIFSTPNPHHHDALEDRVFMHLSNFSDGRETCGHAEAMGYQDLCLVVVAIVISAYLTLAGVKIWVLGKLTRGEAPSGLWGRYATI
jgi:hypothetical protein